MATKVKRPKKMTAAQKRNVWKEIGPEAIISITFAPLEEFSIQSDGTIFMEKSNECLPVEMLVNIAGGDSQMYSAHHEWSEVQDTVDDDYGDYAFNPADPCIHSIEIIEAGKEARRVHIPSIDETMEFHEGDNYITIGCQTLTLKDAEAAACAILTWIGYEIA